MRELVRVSAQFARNLLGGDLSIAGRASVAARNLGRRVTMRQGCCGHEGEPGC